MSSYEKLREEIADAFRACTAELGGGEDWSQEYYDHADRILALVAERMGSDEAIQFATWQIRPIGGGVEQEMQDAVNVITAAMRTAGLIPAETEEK